MMAMVTNSTVLVMSNDTIRRANVIANRVGNDAIGIIKAQMIDLLKNKLKNGIAHFIYQKRMVQSVKRGVQLLTILSKQTLMEEALNVIMLTVYVIGMLRRVVSVRFDLRILSKCFKCLDI